MKKILLVCNAGMSTSLLVTRMETAAKAQELEVEILAVPVSQALNILNDWDVVMLGPQVRHYLKQLEKASQGVKIHVIDMKDYGMMNGAKVLASALAVLAQ